jgi:hypothetical protein
MRKPQRGLGFFLQRSWNISGLVDSGKEIMRIREIKMMSPDGSLGLGCDSVGWGFGLRFARNWIIPRLAITTACEATGALPAADAPMFSLALVVGLRYQAKPASWRRQGRIQGSLRCATDGGAVRRFGRDDVRLGEGGLALLDAHSSLETEARCMGIPRDSRVKGARGMGSAQGVGVLRLRLSR